MDHLANQWEGLEMNADDLPFEEDIVRNAYTAKSWFRYLDHKRNASSHVRFLIYDRALRELPDNVELWNNYLTEWKRHTSNKPLGDVAYLSANGAYERALLFLHKVPEIWLEYCSFLASQCKISATRKAFDRALRALPLSQHPRVWQAYIDWIHTLQVSETVVRVYRRFIRMTLSNVEEILQHLLDLNRNEEAARIMIEILDKEAFTKGTHLPSVVQSMGSSSRIQDSLQTPLGSTTYVDVYLRLCETLSKDPERSERAQLNVDAIVRTGLRRFPNHQSRLWMAIADYHIRAGRFERARGLFEESMSSILTVQDFAVIFDAYAQFEESVLGVKMEETQTREAQGLALTEEEQSELDLRLARLELLMDRRPFLVNDVRLRQDPHNLSEWTRRVRLHKDDEQKVVQTYVDALNTVDVHRATGRTSQLWIHFAHFYEHRNDLQKARDVFEKAVQADFRSAEELAHVWREYAEMEVRQEQYECARTILGRATAPSRPSPPAPPVTTVAKMEKSIDSTHVETIRMQLHKVLFLWQFYVDLEESLGTVDTVRTVYNRILDLRIATPQIILNYAAFLEEHRFFEEAFKVYGRGVELFPYPMVMEIWDVYLGKFLVRYGGKKLERTRDLFEQALKDVPPDLSTSFFIMYAKLEEDYGFARNAMRIYDQANQQVQAKDRMDMIDLYIRKATEFFGITYTRPIYERAMNLLTNPEAKDLCLRYADVEAQLGEIDRARAIYVYASQLCDPRIVPLFWQTWQDFEVHHGNEDTFREMLRIKRSVQARYSTQMNAELYEAMEKLREMKRGVDNVPSDHDMNSPMPNEGGTFSTFKAFLPASTVVTTTANSSSEHVPASEEIDLDMLIETSMQRK